MSDKRVFLQSVLKFMVFASILMMFISFMFLAVYGFSSNQGEFKGEKVSIEGLGDGYVNKLDESRSVEVEYELGPYKSENIDVYAYYLRNVNRLEDIDSDKSTPYNTSHELFTDFQLKENVNVSRDNNTVYFSSDKERSLFVLIKSKGNSFKRDKGIVKLSKKASYIFLMFTLGFYLSYIYVKKKRSM